MPKVKVNVSWSEKLENYPTKGFFKCSFLYLKHII